VERGYPGYTDYIHIIAGGQQGWQDPVSPGVAGGMVQRGEPRFIELVGDAPGFHRLSYIAGSA